MISQARVPLSSIRDELLFLHEHGASRDLLHEFGLTDGHLRVLKTRRNRPHMLKQINERSLYSGWALHPCKDAFLASDELRELESSAVAIHRRAFVRGDYEQAIKQLYALRQRLGSIKEARQRRVLARIHQFLADLYLNLDYLRSSIWNARYAMIRSLEAYDKTKSWESIDLERFAESGWIASLASLVRGDRHQALADVEATRARIGTRIPLSYRYYKILGRYWLWQDKVVSRDYFHSAMATLEHERAANNSDHLRLIRVREMSIVAFACAAYNLVRLRSLTVQPV